MPQAQPELKKVSAALTMCTLFAPETSTDVVSFLQYMDKRVFCQLNGNRKVIGILRGYDVCSHSVAWSFKIPGHPLARRARRDKNSTDQAGNN